MNVDEAQYFTNRALAELRAASGSRNEDHALAHLQLSDLLLQHARDLIAGSIADVMPAMPLRLVERIAA